MPPFARKRQQEPQYAKRVNGSTYVIQPNLTGPPVNLGDLKGIPEGHRVYFVAVQNLSLIQSAGVGSQFTSDWIIAPGGEKDFYFVDPANMTFASTGGIAVILDVDVSGEFPGTCPVCDRADG